MKQKVKRLIQDIQECADLLQQHGEHTWAAYLKQDLKLLRKHGRKVLDDRLHLLRHQEDLAQLRLCRTQGHLIAPMQEDEVNEHLEDLRSAMRAVSSTVVAGCSA